MTISCETSVNHSHGSIAVMWKTVSEACNLACDYCYYSRCGGQPSHIDRIDDAVLEKFIAEYMAMTNGVASFTWQGGEPLLAGLDFFKKVVSLQAKYSKRNTIISNAVQTNATLIDEEWAQFFKQYDFLIGVSLDGPKEVHDARRVTGSGKGSYDRVMKGIKALRKYKVEFNILTVLHEGNVTKANELMDFYKREQFPYVQFIPCMDFRAQETDKAGRYLITPKQYGDFLCESFDHWYNAGEPNQSIRFFDNILNIYLHREAEICIHRKTCPKTLILEQNGDAYPCDFYINDEYKIGNVGLDSLQDILNSPIYSKFLSMKPELPEKCKSCPYLNLCHGGCPRNRKWDDIHENGDVDYFCASYMQIYQYAHVRMQEVADRIKVKWVNNYIRATKKVPGRNDRCTCGSGKKFKNCCESLKEKASTNVIQLMEVYK